MDVVTQTECRMCSSNEFYPKCIKKYSLSTPGRILRSLGIHTRVAGSIFMCIERISCYICGLQ